MRKADVTSTVPQPRDSEKQFSVAVARAGQARRSRGLVKALIVPAVAAAGLVGPNVFYAIDDSRQAGVKTAIEKMEAKPAPSSLRFAQATAAQKLFGLTGTGINIGAAREAANKPGKGELLNVSGYVSPEHVQIGKDGKSFTVDGQEFALVRTTTKEGGVNILAGRSFVEEGIFQDRDRLVGTLLVGGAKNDATSDLNKDGVVTPEEVRKSADQSARHNLEIAFQPPTRINK